MATETQDFIDEVRTPGRVTPAQIKAGLASLIPDAGAAAEQVEIWARLLSSADITEADEGLRQLMQEGFQKFGAMRRCAVEIQRHAQGMEASRREAVDWGQRFLAAAADAGYTTT